MPATVRMFSHAGIATAFVASHAEQLSFPALTLLQQRYLARASITATTGSAQSSSAALAPANTRLLHVQVEPGKRVHYELTPNGQTAVAADTSSPIVEGNTILQFGSGWTISLLEAS